MKLNWESQQRDLKVATTRDGEAEMKLRHHLEVVTGNLKLSQAKSQLGKPKLQPFCYSRIPREVVTNH